MPVKSPQIAALQAELQTNAYLPAEHGDWPALNVGYLTGLSARLTSVGYS